MVNERKLLERTAWWNAHNFETSVFLLLGIHSSILLIFNTVQLYHIDIVQSLKLHYGLCAFVIWKQAAIQYYY